VVTKGTEVEVEVARLKVANLSEQLRNRGRAVVTKTRANIGAEIKQAREAARLPVEFLAGIVGVESRTVQLWEAGQSIPDQPQRLAKALRLDVEMFVEAVEKARRGG
jgi:DNA-binding transcriptional regulator YiaG